MSNMGRAASAVPLICITPCFVILNLFQDNAPPLPVILKQVQDDDDSGFGTMP
jgi:hypothetical protein